jgi:serine/threonine protein kinase
MVGKPHEVEDLTREIELMKDLEHPNIVGYIGACVSTTLHYILLHYILLHYILLHYILLHCTALNCTTLWCTPLRTSLHV